MSKNNSIDVITAVVIEKNSPITFEELCHALQADEKFVIELVELHVLEPDGTTYHEWRFDSENFRRAKIAARFYHDLEINMNGIALALDLLDEIERLRQR